ncbi:uncharacterized protein FA14DRAFT_180965 [Meira miltonrushii]|uniref:Uncharacterized protein n=1 Tax=Meira miltonrushii TaxID=1280837 RepID=A0A316VEA0_9BASI|nr:uncharacterized protein FA14DRAFT_180965 [Meira miltonrushii]PWN34341.1 hypothetical protein FA14DRAFT_180965 [Meira miltonrushii]
MYTNRFCSIFLIFLNLQTIVAVFDLNRTPSPEPPEEQTPQAPAAQSNPTRKDITELKRSSRAPGIQASAIAIASGYPKGSKEYKKVYFHHYHSIRRQQKEQFFEGRVADPKLALKQEKQRKNESIAKANKARAERRRAGTLTPADEWYYERCAKWQREKNRKNPEYKRKRNADARERKRARLAEQKEKANKEKPADDK